MVLYTIQLVKMNKYEIFSVFIIFYYFYHIILLSIELRNMSMFEDHEVCHSSAVILSLFTYY
jgi:hypothetical protein